jgi:ABC-type lipoprotein export system ATPase subunit
VPAHQAESRRRERVLAALDSVGLADPTRHVPSELSGGQQQRVRIARALVKQPSVLLADEPTGSLDTATRDEIMSLLETLWREHGLTLVLVTHDSVLAARAQRHATMDDGHLSISAAGTECQAAHWITDDDLERLRDGGLPDAELVEVVWTACIFNAVVRLVDTFGLSVVGQFSSDTGGEQP